MITENQKKAIKNAINYYTNPDYKSWHAVKIDGKYKEGNTIVFSSQKENGSLYFKVINSGKMLYIGIIYGDNIVNNFDCVGYLKNKKAIKRAVEAFKSLGENREIIYKIAV